jgi:hypothetical protein
MIAFRDLCDARFALDIGPTRMELDRRDVRFGSLANICSAKGHVRFAPNSDRESGFPQRTMSALPPKADKCGALSHVCFGPEADIVNAIGSPTKQPALSPDLSSIALLSPDQRISSKQ